MKRILVFLGLKVAEIGGACGLFAINSYWACIFEPEANFWIAGIIGTLLFFIALALAIIVYFAGRDLVLKNWEWSKRITDK